MKKLLLFSLILVALFIFIIPSTTNAYWIHYCNWSGCCSDASCLGVYAIRLGGSGGCGSKCVDDNWIELDQAWCTPVSQGCPSGAGNGDKPHRTPDAP